MRDIKMSALCCCVVPRTRHDGNLDRAEKGEMGIYRDAQPPGLAQFVGPGGHKQAATPRTRPPP